MSMTLWVWSWEIDTCNVLILWNDHEFLCSAAHSTAQGTITCCQPPVPTPWFSLLVAALHDLGYFLRLSADLLRQEFCTAFNETFATWATFDAHYQRFGKYIRHPRQNESPNHDVWQQLQALKTGVRNEAKSHHFQILFSATTGFRNVLGKWVFYNIMFD